ncbi:hypothetical protein HK097_008159 [Rhizophlyctis rosea]|uniref:Zn(2)-C6 fungal-type domain-containing protein n=1 Tax=Rhizophlyctis rosea TaxID=64517 RepID=A0AAD5SC75_9FUNG|nr:hypothetical protein HK097_008159 [Rhizophlyctis rosea]
MIPTEPAGLKQPSTIPLHLLPDIPPPRYRSACDACRSKKVKCVPSSDSISSISSTSSPGSSSASPLTPATPSPLEPAKSNQFIPALHPPPCAPCLRNNRPCTFGTRTPRRPAARKNAEADSDPDEVDEDDETVIGSAKRFKFSANAAAKRMGPRAQITASLRAKIKETEEKIRKLRAVAGSTLVQSPTEAEDEHRLGGDETDGDGETDDLDDDSEATRPQPISNPQTPSARRTATIRPTPSATLSSLDIQKYLSSATPPYGYVLTEATDITCPNVSKAKRKATSAKDLFWPWDDDTKAFMSEELVESYVQNIQNAYSTNPSMIPILHLLSKSPSTVAAHPLMRNAAYGLGALHHQAACEDDSSRGSIPQMFLNRARKEIVKVLELSNVEGVLGLLCLGILAAELGKIKLAGRYSRMAIRMAVGLGLDLAVSRAGASTERSNHAGGLYGDDRFWQQIWAACAYAEMSVSAWGGSGGRVSKGDARSWIHHEAGPKSEVDAWGDEFSGSMDEVIQIYLESLAYGAKPTIGGADFGIAGIRADDVRLKAQHIMHGHPQHPALYDHGLGPPNSHTEISYEEFKNNAFTKLELLLKGVSGGHSRRGKNAILEFGVSEEGQHWRHLMLTLQCWCTMALVGSMRGHCPRIGEACTHVAEVLSAMLDRDHLLRNVPWSTVHLLFMTSMVCGRCLVDAGGDTTGTVRRVVRRILKCLEVLGRRWVVAKVSAIRIRATIRVEDEPAGMKESETGGARFGVGCQQRNDQDGVLKSTNIRTPDLAAAAEAVATVNAAARVDNVLGTVPSTVTAMPGQSNWTIPNGEPSFTINQNSSHGALPSGPNLVPSTLPGPIPPYQLNDPQLRPSPPLPISYIPPAYIAPHFHPGYYPQSQPSHPYQQPYRPTIPPPPPLPYPPFPQPSQSILANQPNAGFGPPPPQGFRYPIPSEFAPPVFAPSMQSHYPLPIPPHPIHPQAMNRTPSFTMAGSMSTNSASAPSAGPQAREILSAGGPWMPPETFAGLDAGIVGPRDLSTPYPFGPI